MKIKKALVTGGNGFVGRYLVEQLLAAGAEVNVIGRNVYPELQAQGVRTFVHDLSRAADCGAAMAGCDVVFHTAAKAGAFGDWQSYFDNNVTATQNCMTAALEAGVPKFVFTSSPSVVFGRESLEGANESQPYPDRYLAPYPQTKAMAEKFVLAQKGILAVALRPHLIFGPRDPHLVPRLIERARKGALVQVGEGKNKVDVSYVENVAAGHLMAAEALSPGSPLAGKAYFISQNEPVELWPFLAKILQHVGAPPVKRRISYNTARMMGAVLEAVHERLRLPGEPRMTPFLAAQLATSHWFDQSAARRDFGYHAQISTEEALRRTGNFFSQAR